MNRFVSSLSALTILFAAIVAVSCEPEDQENRDIIESFYLGTLTVEQNDGADYIQDSVKIEILPVDNSVYVRVIMRSVKFSPKMPISLDMTIPLVSCSTDNENIYLSGDSIVPLALGGEYPHYIITNMSGKIDNQNYLVLDMKCGAIPLSYFGQLHSYEQ